VFRGLVRPPLEVVCGVVWCVCVVGWGQRRAGGRERAALEGPTARELGLELLAVRLIEERLAGVRRPMPAPRGSRTGEPRAGRASAGASFVRRASMAAGRTSPPPPPSPPPAPAEPPAPPPAALGPPVARPSRPAGAAREALGWPSKYKLARAVVWECSCKELKQLLGELGVCATCVT
jgi:hypothetical protein